MINLVYYDDSISMLERTAFKLLPIITEVCTKMIKYKENGNKDVDPTSRVSQYTTTHTNTDNITAMTGQKQQVMNNVGGILLT